MSEFLDKVRHNPISAFLADSRPISHINSGHTRLSHQLDASYWLELPVCILSSSQLVNMFGSVSSCPRQAVRYVTNNCPSILSRTQPNIVIH